MKNLKKIVVVFLISCTFLVTANAGIYTLSNSEVPALNTTNLSGYLQTTESTNKGITGTLRPKGNTVDKVIMWTRWFYDETRKSAQITVLENNTSVTGYNLNNEVCDKWAEVEVEWKNGNSGINFSYTIDGSANYY